MSDSAKTDPAGTTMPIDLLAQQGGEAFRNGLILGTIVAVIISAAIPISLGLTKGQEAIGLVGGAIAGTAAVFLGCLGGLPIALIFVVIILILGDNRRKYRRRAPTAYEDDEDDNDRPWKRRYRDDDEERHR